jgi:hypothetical protein
MKGSHLFIEEFYETHKKAAFRSNLNKYHHMKDEDIEWFESKGCKTSRIAVPILPRWILVACQWQ